MTWLPKPSAWELLASGMRIGRDHIASTVYTIASSGRTVPPGRGKRDAPPSTWLLGSLDGPSIAERQLENLGLLSWLSIDAFQERSEEIL